jgi:deoxyribonuclease-4
MSIQGGFVRAVERAISVDARALQIFVKSARQWAAPPLVAADVDAFRDAARRAGLAPYVVAHASYLINLASPEQTLRSRSMRALGEEIDRCARLGVPHLVLHPGSHMGDGVERGVQRIARGLDRVLGARGRSSGDRVTVLLENTAGQGTNLGRRFEEIGAIIEQSAYADRLGLCFDTCHALAAGYAFDDAGGYRATFAQLDAAVGIGRLRVFHLNDSKFERGSRRDRHEHIGRGHVGLDGFRRILTDRRFRDLPMLLETPKGADLADDRMNLATLRSLPGRRTGRGPSCA